MREKAGPFEGLNVVELSELVSGPYCTRMLGAMGADVIKVEAVGGGDRSRACGPFLSDSADPELSALFLYLNTNKKSVTLDWEAPEGREILKRLLAQADVLVENHPPGYLQRLDLSYTDLREINPALVVVSLSPFGSFGPYAEWETTPLVDLALGGYLFLTGEADREPLALPGYQADYLAALHGYAGCLLALLSRADSGEGQHVEVATMEVLASLHQFTTVMYTYGGTIRRRHGNRWETADPYSRYPITVLPCKDGYVSFAVSTERQWELMCSMVDRADLIDNPRMSTFRDRRRHADEIDAILIDWMKDKTKEEVFHLAAGVWSVPVAPLSSLPEVLADPQFRDRGLWATAYHPEAGRLEFPSLPFTMSDGALAFEAAPLLGEHNREVYQSRLGYDEAELSRLSKLRVI